MPLDGPYQCRWWWIVPETKSTSIVVGTLSIYTLPSTSYSTGFQHGAVGGVVKGKQGPGKECPVMMTGSFHRMQTAPYHYGHLRKDFCREERDLRSIVSIQCQKNCSVIPESQPSQTPGPSTRPAGCSSKRALLGIEVYRRVSSSLSSSTLQALPLPGISLYVSVAEHGKHLSWSWIIVDTSGWLEGDRTVTPSHANGCQTPHLSYLVPDCRASVCQSHKWDSGERLL
ncbi:hypothetical protein M430DRAFT_269777 [Amorphotheca resinae ATCC 22711]|uniref:Uncharacterized protein n=1 Tax=Amorphotheca resinae ATCC 22711 TaxID=857342 RepID=A0A2T3BG52_AMORE|nr:hypothetical protein M430DRAFT_269777 [Amorphotheca resinae ATCC 22711]PSS28354.1 hypothetical protein M430DRAFT_269777 [Amorphotheca resinae ATCC 22711]